MKYKIGEVTNVLGISPDLLRYYEKKGVVRPQKGIHNDYRYYDAWDINFLTDCLWFKNFGFSIEQISDMVRSYTASDITEMFSSKEEELRAVIRRCELLIRRSSEYRSGVERMELLGQCDVSMSPSGICYLNRYGDEYPDNEENAPLARKWLELMPYCHRYFEFSESALRGEDPAGYRWGYFLSSDYVSELGVEAVAPMAQLESVKSIHTVCKSSGKGKFSAGMLDHAMRFSAENGHSVAGPARGTLLASVSENGELTGYFEVWIPVR